MYSRNIGDNKNKSKHGVPNHRAAGDAGGNVLKYRVHPPPLAHGAEPNQEVLISFSFQ